MKDESVVWQLEKDSHLLTLIAKINDKCRKAGKDEHSVEYWCEELLARGATAFSNYLDADADRRNRENYVKEMGRIMVPAPNADPEVFAAAMAEYASKVSGLQRKYKIGGTQVEVK